MAVLISLGVILTVLVAGDITRRVARKTFKNPTVRNLALDALLSIETVAVGFEMGVINELYGVYFWLGGIFLNCLYQSFRWSGLQPPIPYMHLCDYLDGTQTLVAVLLRTLVMASAGIATHRYLVTPLWHLELSGPHIGRSVLTSSPACRVPWAQAVSVAKSFWVELVGTLFLTVGPNLAVDNPTLQNNEPRLINVLISAMVVVAVWAGMDMSGGFYSPMLASAVFGGCHGHSLTEHFVIYWVGATLGAVVGHLVYPTIKSVIYRKRSAAAEKDAKRKPEKIKSN